MPEMSGGITVGGGGNVARAIPAKQSLWLPTGVIDETMDREKATVTSNGITAGTLRLNGRAVLPASQAITSIRFWAGTTAGASLTQCWFCLVRMSDLSVLAKTTSDTTAAWTASTARTIAIAGGPYTPAEDIGAYLGIVVTGTTPPTLNGAAVNATLSALTPLIAMNSTTGLTDPASLGATAVSGAASAQSYAAIL